MNRTDRLYALVEELRAISPRCRSAGELSERLQVGVRTVERDIKALRKAGVPVRAEDGGRGGYALDETGTPSPLGLTPDEAVAVAIALSRAARRPLAGGARTALRKLKAAMSASAGARPPAESGESGECGEPADAAALAALRDFGDVESPATGTTGSAKPADAEAAPGAEGSGGVDAERSGGSGVKGSGGAQGAGGAGSGGAAGSVGADGERRAAVARVIDEALLHRQVVRITYDAKSGEVTERDVEPGVFIGGRGGFWYLVGWCRLREDVRVFRLDRIAGAALTDEQAHPRRPLEEYAPHIPDLMAQDQARG
ncbi:helix-turn-helix transcriptional regulator [Sphaerisporangium dianthi]|uniref:Helix-turn-helix transcriptional regulator n=1 Tax=Sphaerisporangium dianthi TaxID=1436120 RepID=A0ABV9CFW7_9ACTN